MKIAICVSMNFSREALDVERELKARGHEVLMPEGCGEYAEGLISESGEEGARRKMENDFIRRHYNAIASSDAILVLNYDKRGVENYIGGNVFLEIGFAYTLEKKIFLLKPIPDLEYIRDEVVAMEPRVLDENLSLIV